MNEQSAIWHEDLVQAIALAKSNPISSVVETTPAEAQVRDAISAVLAKILSEVQDHRVILDSYQQMLITIHDGVLHWLARTRTNKGLGVSKRQIVRYMGATSCYMCLCCNKVPVLSEEGDTLPGAQFDHPHGPSDNSLESLWLVCSGCNLRLKRSQFRQSRMPKFESFQVDLREWMEQQIGDDMRQVTLFEALPHQARQRVD